MGSHGQVGAQQRTACSMHSVMSLVHKAHSATLAPAWLFLLCCRVASTAWPVSPARELGCTELTVSHVLCSHCLPCAGGASNSKWANEFVNDAEGAAYADWEDLYAKNAAVSHVLLLGTL
jgi:hypothetical protein